MREEKKFKMLENYKEDMEALRLNAAAIVYAISILYLVITSILLPNHPVFRLVTVNIFYIGMLRLLNANGKVCQALVVIAFIFALGLSANASPSIDVSSAVSPENTTERQQLSWEDRASRDMAINMEKSIAEEYLYALTRGESADEIVEIHQLHHCAASACSLKTLCKCDYNSFVKIK